MKRQFYMYALEFKGLLCCSLTIFAASTVMAIFDPKIDKSKLKETLTTLQYEVTQNDGTERAFKNEYWNNKAAGIYVDIVSGEPLFSSLDKYDSKTGWPSFTKPIDSDKITTRTDGKLFLSRTEVRSKLADSHLGHVFNDGPTATGKRYCLNSAALRFVAVSDLEKEGYGKYLSLFASAKTKSAPSMEKAIFAGGCFWCMEADFEKLKGVGSVDSGYAGGNEVNPTYQKVSSGQTGHTEAIEVTFDPKVISYQNLLDVFWVNIDPTAKDQQFCDKGKQYRSAIFYLDESQKNLAMASKEKLKKTYPKMPIFTQITLANKFYQAEAYHQQYYQNNPIRYRFYRFNCQRDQILQKLWGSEREAIMAPLLKAKK